MCLPVLAGGEEQRTIVEELHPKAPRSASAKAMCSTNCYLFLNLETPTSLDYHLVLQAHGAQAHIAQMDGSRLLGGIDP